MLLTKQVTLKWNSKNKYYYIDKGYLFTKMKEEFVVPIEDLSRGSDHLVEIRCDYCGKIVHKTYIEYLKQNYNSPIKKDACNQCKYLKQQEICQLIHGVKSPFGLKEIQEKSKQTNLRKYGVAYYFQSEDKKEKTKQTNLQKYGVENYAQTEEYLEKIKNTCQIKYNVDNVFQIPEIIEKSKKTCLLKYGTSLYSKSQYYTETMSGENSPLWNHDKSMEERVIKRKYHEYICWRNEVFKRDNYICQCCGDNKGGNLNAHHLDGYDWCKDKRLDVDNGITLCEGCHKAFHMQYGFGQNTSQQFNQYINPIKFNSYQQLVNILYKIII